MVVQIKMTSVRDASAIVNAATTTKCKIRLHHDNRIVEASSFLGVLSIGATQSAKLYLDGSYLQMRKCKKLLKNQLV